MNFENLLGSLGQYRDVIQANRRAFQSAEEAVEESALEESMEEK